jgi:hypothetical protein
MAELVSYLSNRTAYAVVRRFTPKHSAPLTRGFFCAARAISCASFAALPRAHMIHLSWPAVCPICDSSAPDFLKRPRARRWRPAAGRAYGADLVELLRLSASYVDRILRGAHPSDLPVQSSTKFELIINLKTAKALGLEVSPTLLAIADEVIE